MISHMVENAVFVPNALPINSGMIFTIFLWTLMMGTTINFKKHCKIRFGAYAEAHETNSHKNTRNPAQNRLYASDQQETSKVNIGYSTSVQDYTSKDVPLPLSPY